MLEVHSIHHDMLDMNMTSVSPLAQADHEGPRIDVSALAVFDTS
jgi:hypothetical protein